MEFDKSRVFTAVNAHKLKVGSKVYTADSLWALKKCVEDESYITTLEKILPEDRMLRFSTNDGSEYALAYLISEPEENKLKVSDLKIGDVVRHKTGKLEFLITGIDNDVKEVFFGGDWSDNENLGKFWEKVEK